MIFKHIFICGFLFATACATGTPNVATLDVLPNFDQGLTRKDFRVIYPGVQGGGSDVTIKIYKEDQSVFHTFDVPEKDADKQKEYYFGLNDATSGKYEIQVCKSGSCSSKTSSLSNIPSTKGQVKCPKGRIADGEWKEEEGQELALDVIENGAWLTQADIDSIESAMNPEKSESSTSSSRKYTEWGKYNIKSNPGYEKEVLYVGVNYDMLQFKDMFMTEAIAESTGQTKSDNLYVDEFCERKYFLSFHVHLLNKTTKEVKYRFKRTLHMSEKGKKYFIIDNRGGSSKRLVHVEMAFKDTKISEGTYMVWVSLCTTEKDVNDSTMCSDPDITKELNVSSTSPSQ